ncbi:unnamed protein product [Rotaria sp. Silwood2]|nr:unnamed protein product [Rotaria sp. Silwood2]
MSDTDKTASSGTSSSSSNSSSSLNVSQQYSTSSLEILLKQKGEPKQYIVLENKQKHLSSPAWSTFGFPAKRLSDGSYERIMGFASCSDCKDTYTYQSDGSGSTKHMLRHVCSKSSSSETNQHGPMDKFMKPRKSSSVKLCAQERTRIQDEFTKWICSSMRPFNLMSDPGMKTTLKTIVDICVKHGGSIDFEDIFVTPATISNNVNRLAQHYRSLIQPILIKQAECGALAICPDLWTDNHKKINSLGLTVYFVTSDSDFELYTFDLCCSRFNEIDKTGESVLKVNSITPKKKLKKVQNICDTSSDDSSSEDDTITPSPSKFAEANTLLTDLPPKVREILATISTSKKLVKYVKITGLNKVIEERGGLALKQECIVRWLSLSNMLESIDASIEYIRSLLLSKSFKNEWHFKLNIINIDALKDLISLLSEFKNVSLLVQTGTRPSLHMAYISINKLERHLNGTDADEEGEIINIYDRHEGNNERNDSD